MSKFMSLQIISSSLLMLNYIKNHSIMRRSLQPSFGREKPCWGRVEIWLGL